MMMLRNGRSCHVVLLKCTPKEVVLHPEEMGPQQASLLGQHLRQEPEKEGSVTTQY